MFQNSFILVHPFVPNQKNVRSKWEPNPWTINPNLARLRLNRPIQNKAMQDEFDRSTRNVGPLSSPDEESLLTDEIGEKRFNNWLLRPDLLDYLKKLQSNEKRWSRQFSSNWVLKPNFPVATLPQYQSKGKRWGTDVQNQWALKLNFPVSRLPNYQYKGYYTNAKRMGQSSNELEPYLEDGNITPEMFDKKSVPYYLLH